MPPISGSQNKQVSSLNNSSNSICFRRQLAFKSLWKRRDEEDEGARALSSVCAYFLGVGVDTFPSGYMHFSSKVFSSSKKPEQSFFWKHFQRYSHFEVVPFNLAAAPTYQYQKRKLKSNSLWLYQNPMG